MAIKAYQTHYEISDYTLGDCKELENQLSIFDNVNYKLTTYFKYDLDTKTLYVPRGYDESKLITWFGEIEYGIKSNVYQSTHFNLVYKPRNITQREAIRFLIGRDEYEYTKNVSQLVLSLPGGAGKTFCTIAALSILKVKSLIITHNTEIRNQWVDRILSYTDVSKDQIKVLSSSEELLSFLDKKNKHKIKNVSFFITNHRLLDSFMTNYGEEKINDLMVALGIGVKVIDEAHKEFMNILRLDYNTNISKTFYLTATFGRSDAIENAVFQRCFERIFKLKKTDDSMGNTRTIFHIADFFHSHMTAIEVASMSIRSTKKFSIQRYFSLEMEYGTIFERLRNWIHWYYEKRNGKNKMIIISPKKSSCDACCNIALELYPEKKCCAHYTGNKVQNLSEYDVICATSAMLGTGFDMDGLEIVINLEPTSSKVNIDQMMHRLMRGKSSTDSYYIEIIDADVPTVVRMYEKRKRVSKTFSKHIIEIGKK